VGQIVIPLLNVCLFGYILGKEPNGMKLNFVNDDWNSLQTSKEVQQYCDQYNEMKNRTCLSGGISPLCSFFNQFEDNEIIWVTKMIVKIMKISNLFVFFLNRRLKPWNKKLKSPSKMEIPSAI
jgi:hypothetical protein